MGIFVTNVHLNALRPSRQSPLKAKYAEAERMCERSIAIRENISGPNHPDTAESLDTLAELMRKQVGSSVIQIR